VEFPERFLHIVRLFRIPVQGLAERRKASPSAVGERDFRDPRFAVERSERLRGTTGVHEEPQPPQGGGMNEESEVGELCPELLLHPQLPASFLVDEADTR
jgi:hypothetical protein